MHFPSEHAVAIKKAFLAVPHKYSDLLIRYTSRSFGNARAQEYARHGFGRRLQILVRCLEKVFEILPLDRTARPTRDELSDAMINIQAFVLNVFGCTDNLAWTWVHEKGLTKKDGSQIPASWVGLSTKNERIRSSFSEGFQTYLNGLDSWFDLQESYRHALAHRIPLYIPPYIVPTDKEAAIKELEERKTAAMKRRDFLEYDRLEAEADALGVFTPWIMHSFEEKATPLRFHPQMLADFNTIVELGQKLLQELDRPSPG